MEGGGGGGCNHGDDDLGQSEIAKRLKRSCNAALWLFFSYVISSHFDSVDHYENRMRSDHIKS